ncbi:MAG: FG-GAP repeat protein, partial [Chloroflexi bacterium]|nr:FG-GAP repeat protein [Chloroflexota bacterium]
MSEGAAERVPGGAGGWRSGLRAGAAAALILASSLGLSHGRSGPGASVAAQGGALRAPAVEHLAAWGGYSAVAPENTLAAIAAARSAGASRLWLDLRATADGQLVLLRDATLERTTDCSGRVADLPAATVGRCDAGSWFDPAFAGQTVPSLADALAAAGPLETLVELHAGSATALVDAIRGAGADGLVTVVSRDRALLSQLAAISSLQIHTRLRVDQLDARLAQELPASGIGGVATVPSGLEPTAAATLRGAGLALALGPADDEAALLAALEADVEAIAVARFEPLAWVAGLAFRNYSAPDFGLSLAEDQQLGGGLGGGDFNGDGRDDLVLGAPRDDGAAPGAGWLGLLIGGAAFPGRLVADPGDEREGEWGSVFEAADLNGDGFDDLVVGVPQRDFNGGNSGAIWLWDGAADGIGRFKRPIGPQPAPGSRLGRVLASGDFNADGMPDLAVAAPEQVVRGQNGAGRVFVLPGERGLGAVTTGALGIDREPEEVPGDPLGREGLGDALAMGDFNGDGHADLAIGAPGARPNELTGAGALLLVFGAPNDPETGDLTPLRYVELSRDIEAIGSFAEQGAGFGGSLAAADLDGDGFDDLVVGAPGATADNQRGAGDLTLLFGRADRGDPEGPDAETGAFDLPRTRILDLSVGAIPGEPAGRAAFGARLGLADLDADGRPELLVASSEGQGRLTGAGALYGLFGGPAGPDPRRPFRLAPGMAGMGLPAVGAQAFAARFGVADLNGDGVADLAIGAPGSVVGGLDRA